jgi:hypothetical protein
MWTALGIVAGLWLVLMLRNSQQTARIAARTRPEVFDDWIARLKAEEDREHLARLREFTYIKPKG